MRGSPRCPFQIPLVRLEMMVSYVAREKGGGMHVKVDSPTFESSVRSVGKHNHLLMDTKDNIHLMVW